MLGMDTGPDPGIYLMADHLDAALAAGEDLLAVELPLGEAGLAAKVASIPAGLADAVQMLRRHEAQIVARVLQARRRAADLARLEGPARPVIQLLLANTSGVLDLIAHFGDGAEERFHAGSDVVSFLRSRHVLDAEAGGLPRFERLSITNAYRIAGVIEIGPLLDLIATALDSLDAAYGLYLDDETEEAGATSTPPGAAEKEAAVVVVPASGELAARTNAEADPTDAAEAASDVQASANVTPGSLSSALAELRRTEP